MFWGLVDEFNLPNSTAYKPLTAYHHFCLLRMSGCEEVFMFKDELGEQKIMSDREDQDMQRQQLLCKLIKSE